jgi:NitT/TauT family transport system substrate-binding protein
MDVFRRRFLRTAAFWSVAALVGVAAGALPSDAWAEGKKELLVAEPNHNAAYLPLYVAIRKGFFGDGVDAKVITTRGGGEHTNMVLTKQAFAFIGGPEHNAFAKLKGAELRAIVNIVNRGNVYFVAREGLAPPADHDWKTFLKGKRIATGIYGGTPNSITRLMVVRNGLDPAKDVQLLETESSAVLASVKAGAADIAVTSEPSLTQGVRVKVWGEPFYNVPKEFGPYAYSTFNVREDVVKSDPQLAETFVRGIVKALRFVYENRAETVEVARAEFPTMPPEDLQALLDRLYGDEMWSEDGIVSPEAWTTAQEVVRSANVLKADVPYDDIFDMSIVKKVLAQASR